MSPEEQLGAALARVDVDRLSLEDLLTVIARLRDRSGQRINLNPAPFIRLLPKIAQPGAPR